MTEKTPTTCGSDSSTELGLLPIGPHDHPEPRTMMWSALELDAIKEYAARCVAAERERWVKTSENALEALEWHAGGFCEDSIPQDTVDAIGMLRTALQPNAPMTAAPRAVD